MRIYAHEVVRYVARLYDMKIEDLIGPFRQRRYVRPRQIAMYAIHELCPHMSYPAIGNMLGNRDHTTIMHGVGKIEQLMPLEQDILRAVENVLQHFRPPAPVVAPPARYPVDPNTISWDVLCAAYAQAMRPAA